MSTVAPPAPVRRPRLRRPAHEPDPVEPGPPRWPDPAPIGSRPVRWPPESGAAPEPAATPGPSFPDRPVRPESGGHADDPAADPDVPLRRHVTALVRTVVEVLGGRRAPAHLTGLARPEVARYCAANRRSDIAAPRRVHVSRPGPDVVEIVAVCRAGTRFRAFTARLDRDPDGAWRATAARLL